MCKIDGSTSSPKRYLWSGQCFADSCKLEHGGVWHCVLYRTWLVYHTHTTLRVQPVHGLDSEFTKLFQQLPNTKIASIPKLDNVMRQIKSHQARTMSGSQPHLPINQTFCWNFRRHESQTHRTWTTYHWKGGAQFRFVNSVIDDSKNSTLMHIRLKSSKPDPFCNRVDVFQGRTGELVKEDRQGLYSPLQTGPNRQRNAS